ncbi:hypothetical protein LX36DRAFT_657575 [Colletotrichum falcatum]|nr:hypothetical protein LX36DRAFT_657575 [Colletotrichum falcatum]
MFGLTPLRTAFFRPSRFPFLQPWLNIDEPATLLSAHATIDSCSTTHAGRGEASSQGDMVRAIPCNFGHQSCDGVSPDEPAKSRDAPGITRSVALISPALDAPVAIADRYPSLAAGFPAGSRGCQSLFCSFNPPANAEPPRSWLQPAFRILSGTRSPHGRSSPGAPAPSTPTPHASRPSTGERVAERRESRVLHLLQSPEDPFSPSRLRHGGGLWA